MKVIKFTLKSPFAFFKSKENIDENYSFPFITKMNVIGGLAAIIGLDGFHKYSRTYHRIINEIEKNNIELTKIKLDELELNVLNSIDKLIELNTKKIDKENTNLISKNETIHYIGTNKSINKLIEMLKTLIYQNELLIDFKNNINILNENIVFNNNLENHFDKFNIAKVNKALLLKRNEELKLELELNIIEYKCLFDNKISIVSKNEINYIKVKFNDATRLGVSESQKFGIVNICEHILTNVEYDIYYELQDNDFDKKIEEYLLEDKRIYDFYLGKNQFIADISNVEILNLNLIKDEKISEFKTISLIDYNLIDKMDINGIKINMPINNLKNGIYSEYKLLINGNYILDKDIEKNNLYSLNKNLLYFI